MICTFVNKKYLEGPRLHDENVLTVDTAYLNPPRGSEVGDYILQVFDPFRTSKPLLEKRHRTHDNAAHELVFRFGQLDAIAGKFDVDEWDAMARYFDYDEDTWVVRPD